MKKYSILGADNVIFLYRPKMIQLLVYIMFYISFFKLLFHFSLNFLSILLKRIVKMYKMTL